MNVTINTFADLLDVINRYPEWRQELRRAIFPEVDLPKALQQLAESQARMEALLRELQSRAERHEGRTGGW